MPPPLSKMSHAARMRHIAQLQAERGGPAKRGKRHAQVDMPDLRVEQRTSPTSDELHHKFSSERRSGAHHKDAKQYAVGNSHKQGYELLTPGTIAAGHLKHMNGSKQ